MEITERCAKSTPTRLTDKQDSRHSKMASTGNINSQNQSQKYNFDPSNISQENSALRATVAETLVD